jgi:hypothetical protein
MADGKNPSGRWAVMTRLHRTGEVAGGDERASAGEEDNRRGLYQLARARLRFRTTYDMTRAVNVQHRTASASLAMGKAPGAATLSHKCEGVASARACVRLAAEVGSGRIALGTLQLSEPHLEQRCRHERARTRAHVVVPALYGRAQLLDERLFARYSEDALGSVPAVARASRAVLCRALACPTRSAARLADPARTRVAWFGLCVCVLARLRGCLRGTR